MKRQNQNHKASSKLKWRHKKIVISTEQSEWRNLFKGSLDTLEMTNKNKKAIIFYLLPIPFVMLSKITFAFLKAVKENNNLEWMNKNRDLYHMERDNFLAFAKELIEKTQKLDKNIGELAVKNATFRFNRDIRFTKDKSPYKGNFGVIICEEGKHGDAAGYYVHIEPGKCFIGGGMYMPSGPTLQRVRMYIAKNYKQLQKIINVPAFKKMFGPLIGGDELKKIPRGFDQNHKAGRLLKMKGRFTEHTLSEKIILQDNFVEYCISVFKIMKPLNDFLNKGMHYSPKI